MRYAIVLLSLTSCVHRMPAPMEPPASVSIFVLHADASAGPVAGQRKGPCRYSIEVEIEGACWIRTEHQPPCHVELYEHQRQCWAPVAD
jgi:hypothetical protein